MVDADHIKDYIFAPHRLKMIRGGSVVLLDLNHEHLLRELRDGGYGPGNLSHDLQIVEAEGVKWELVYAGGGNVLVRFEDQELARQYANQAQRLFRKHSGSATATSIVVRHEHPFRKTFDCGLKMLNLHKTSGVEPRSLLAFPYFKVCEACGREPATWVTEDPDQEELLLCRACHLRKEASPRSPYLKEISNTLEPVDDLEALAMRSRPEGYLALVYLDVDGLGKYFDQLEPFTIDTYRTASKRVHQTVRSAVLDSCRLLSANLKSGSTAPFEILLIGGDDALVMIQPQYLYSFLRCFRVSFRKHWRNKKGLDDRSRKMPTFSAGIVFAHSHLPINHFVHRAEELLRSAKRAGGNRCDYLVLTEAMTSGIKDRDPKRTMRPDSVIEMLRFWKTMRKWKKHNVPSRRIHQLYQAAHEEEFQGTFNYLHLLSRLEAAHRSLLLSMFPQGLWERTPRQATRAADIAELWDFVEEA